MKKNLYIMLIISIICTIGPVKQSSAMAGLTNKLGSWFGSYTPQEEEYINEINKLESISDENELEHAVASHSASTLRSLLLFLQRRGLGQRYPRFLHEANVQMLIKEGLEEESLGQQVEALYDMIKREDFSQLLTMPSFTKARYANYIEKFREQHNAPHAYAELYKLMKTKSYRVEPTQGYYRTTEDALVRHKDFFPLLAHIINLNALELAGPKCLVTKKVHVGQDDYDNIIEIYGDLPEDLDAIFKESSFETLCNELIAQRQVQNECGLMSIYNALQLYSLLNKKIDKTTFEQNLKAFNLDEWITEVENCPIDTSDIVHVMARRAADISKNQYSIIPTIVDDNGQLAYQPLTSRSIVTLPNGDIEANFNQDKSLLQVIQNIHDEEIQTYTHIFFLNNLQIGAQGAAMRHWIPVVLHKENNQLYLYSINSQSVYREDLFDPNDKVVDLDALARVVEKDNIWIRALIKLLSINPNALARGLEIVSNIQTDDYNHNYAPDILEALENDNSCLANELRDMLIR